MTAPVPMIWLAASQVRREERRLLEAFEARHVPVGRIDPRRALFGIEDPPWRGGVVLNREISATRAAVMAESLAADGATVLNSPESVRVTTNKWLTYLALRNAGVPTPRTWLAATPAAAQQFVDEVVFPIVLKPLNASHGNRVSLATDTFAFDAILEHCQELPTALQRMVVLQQYLGAGDSDLRVVVAAGRCVGAISRTGADWRNNVSLGADVERVRVTEEMQHLALAASRAVGTTFAGVDILARDSGELVVLEVNGGMEFAGFESTGERVAEHVVDLCLEHAEGALSA